jgi:hypothetical protein
MLRKPTKIYRATLTEAPTVIVGPDEEGVGTRRVTLLVLSEPTIEIAFDVDPLSTAARDAYWSSMPSSYSMPFEILPSQTVVGRSTDAIHELSVIVEYLS